MDASWWKIAHDRLSLLLREAVNQGLGEKGASMVQVFEDSDRSANNCPRKRLFLGRGLDVYQRASLKQQLVYIPHCLQVTWHSDDELTVMLVPHMCSACGMGEKRYSHTA